MKSRAGGLLLLLTALFPLHDARAVSDPAEMLPNHAQELRAERVGSQLRCLVCQNETIEDSNAGLAKDLRRIVRERIVAGDSDKQVVAWMTARYGDFVRLSPPFEPLTWFLWLSPVIALGAGAAAVLIGRRTLPSAPSALTEAEQMRLERLLKS